jgi:hypothetical protein
MRKFIWCSIHTPSVEQVAELYSVWGMEGSLIALKDIYPNVQAFLDNCSDSYEDMLETAKDLHDIAMKDNAVLVQPGGSPAFQYVLGKVRMTALRMSTVLYAHSERVSEDIPQEDGSVKKVSVFRHAKFIQV